MADVEREFLLFQLYGGLASWGDIAVGEVRPSFERPSKSAVLGLVAAALGVRRHEEALHRRLAQDYGYAVEVRRFGLPLRDYHTVQRPPQRKGADYASRREELAALPREDLATTLSYRDYWQDAVYTVCLWSRVDAPQYPLADLAASLRQPQFVLYLGRKNCPPALPLHPHVVTQPSVAAALDVACFPGSTLLSSLKFGECARYSDEPLGDSDQRLIRRDQPESRCRWQFAERAEYRQMLELEVRP